MKRRRISQPDFYRLTRFIESQFGVGSGNFSSSESGYIEDVVKLVKAELSLKVTPLQVKRAYETAGLTPPTRKPKRKARAKYSSTATRALAKMVAELYQHLDLDTPDLLSRVIGGRPVRGKAQAVVAAHVKALYELLDQDVPPELEKLAATGMEVLELVRDEIEVVDASDLFANNDDNAAAVEKTEI